MSADTNNASNVTNRISRKRLIQSLSVSFREFSLENHKIDFALHVCNCTGANLKPDFGLACYTSC